jgi:hypothetical protein
MGSLSGRAACGWYNPCNGQTTDIGEFDNSDSKEFTTPGNNGNDANDWVFVAKVAQNRVAVQSVKVHTESETTLQIRQTILLAALVSPPNATDPSVQWTSRDPAVASVDNSGAVTAHAEGSTCIIATSVDGDKTDSVCIIVKPEEPVVPVMPGCLSGSNTAHIPVVEEPAYYTIAGRRMVAGARGPARVPGIRIKASPSQVRIQFLSM